MLFGPFYHPLPALVSACDALLLTPGPLQGVLSSLLPTVWGDLREGPPYKDDLGVRHFF